MNDQKRSHVQYTDHTYIFFEVSRVANFRSQTENVHPCEKPAGPLTAFRSRCQVPVLLDTNVSCPEGVNEALSEDDVSWQLKKVK